MKLSGSGILVLLIVGLSAPAMSKAESHNGGGNFGGAGRTQVDPVTGSNNLFNLVSSCLAGRPGDPNSFLPSGNQGNFIQAGPGAGVPVPDVGAGALPPPTGAGTTPPPPSAAGTPTAGPASIDTVRTFVAAKCTGCHQASVSGTTFGDAKVVKGGKSFSLKDVANALDSVATMKSRVPEAVKSQIKAWAAVQN